MSVIRNILNSTKALVNNSLPTTGSNTFVGTQTMSGSIVTIGSSTATSYNGIINATNGVVSGSSQITPLLPTGTISGSLQILGGTGIISSSAQLENATITNLTITNLTTVNETASVIFSSGSNRFGDFGDDTHSFTGSVKISGSLTTIGSSTATSFSGAIAATNGVVSGSSQVTLSSTTGFGTYINQAVLTTSSPTFVGGTFTGALSGTSATFSDNVTVTSASTKGFVVNSTNGASFHGYRIQNSGTDKALFETNANNGEIKIGSIPGDTNDFFPVIYSDGVAALSFGLGATPSATFTGALSGTSATFTAATTPLILKSTAATTMFTEYYYNTSTLAGYIGSGTGLLSGANASDFIIRSEADFVVATGGNNRRLTIASTGAATFSLSVTAAGFVFIGLDGTYGPTYSGISFQGTSAGVNGENRIFAGRAGADGLYLASATSRAIYFRAGGSTSDHLTIASAGAATFSSGISVGGATATTGGIQFPATQVAIASANNLDDYEEGTWTPGFAFALATTGITYSVQAGTYTKIGRQVTVNGYIQLSSKGSASGWAGITGLPFTIPNTNGNYSIASIRVSAITYTGSIAGQANINGTVMELNQTTEAGVLSDILNTNLANNSSIILSLTYFV